ncbi:hypothetical protein ACWCPI_38915 [Streptomyces sp. NPDC001920]
MPAEQHTLITRVIESAEEQLLQLRGVQTGSTAGVARQPLRSLRHSVDLIENAWKRTALASVNAGIPEEPVGGHVSRRERSFADKQGWPGGHHFLGGW